MPKDSSSTASAAPGDILVADYQTVLTGLAMTEVAAHEADRSEQQFMSQLGAISSGYLTPGTLANANEPDITRSSLDVHVKKIQAKQLANLSLQQVAELVQQANKNYVGKRVVVTALEPKNPPIDAVWFDKQAGYYSAQFKKRKITGVIEAVQLDKNVLVLKPTFQRRLIVPNLQQYLVYVIDPASLTPLVTLEIV